MADKKDEEEFKALILKIIGDYEGSNAKFRLEIREELRKGLEEIRHPLYQRQKDGSVDQVLVEDHIRCNVGGNFSIIGNKALPLEETTRRLNELSPILKPIMQKYGLINLHADLIIGFAGPKTDEGNEETTAPVA